MLKGFRDFMMRGNVIDLAVAVIIGAAFTKVVNSLVDDIIMPPLGVVLGKVDFSNLFVVLKEAPRSRGRTLPSRTRRPPGRRPSTTDSSSRPS